LNCSMELEHTRLSPASRPTPTGKRYNENKKLAGSIAGPANEIVA
jgi:hypothetical protein